MNTKIVSIIVIAVLVVGGIFLFRNDSVAPTTEDIFGTQEAGTPYVNDTPETEGLDNIGEVVNFTVEASNFAFSPATMRVKQGDTVRITFKNTLGTHDLRIDEYNVNTTVIGAGEERVVEFVADKTGSFEYYCSVGKHREMGMVGTLTVTE